MALTCFCYQSHNNLLTICFQDLIPTVFINTPSELSPIEEAQQKVQQYEQMGQNDALRAEKQIEELPYMSEQLKSALLNPENPALKLQPMTESQPTLAEIMANAHVDVQGTDQSDDLDLSSVAVNEKVTDESPAESQVAEEAVSVPAVSVPASQRHRLRIHSLGHIFPPIGQRKYCESCCHKCEIKLLTIK